jgi:serine/threonine protein phosphatase PrpC
MAAAQPDEARVTLDAWLVTDVGVVRDHNEDSAFMEPARGVFIVADGMGGHAAGEVASAMAVDTVRRTLERARSEIDAFRTAPSDAGRRAVVQLLQNAVQSAHQAVFQRGQDETDKQGMGTTLDVVLVVGPEAFVAHVGDSRTYLIRDGRSSQITTDHTVAEVLVIEGKLTIEEAQVSPLRTILVNAIGVSPDVAVEMAHVTLKRGDRLLLCSDGLHDYFPVEEEIAQRMSGGTPTGTVLQEMVDLAKSRGGHDNITGVAVQVVDISTGALKAIETESTQPVDVQENPFLDEASESDTAVLPAPKLSSAGGGNAKGLKSNAAKPSSAAHPEPVAKPAAAKPAPPKPAPAKPTSEDSPAARADTIPPGSDAPKAVPAPRRTSTPPKGIPRVSTPPKGVPATATIPPIPSVPRPGPGAGGPEAATTTSEATTSDKKGSG